MDRHEFSAQTAAETAAAHLKDLAVQDQFGVRFLTYWFDDERQTAFCLARAPDRDAVDAAHHAAHGLTAYQIVEVDRGMVDEVTTATAEHSPVVIGQVGKGAGVTFE